MSKYRVMYAGEFEDEIFDTEEAAEEYALYLVSCAAEGAEILSMSNLEYDEEDYDDEYEIIEVDD